MGIQEIKERKVYLTTYFDSKIIYCDKGLKK